MLHAKYHGRRLDLWVTFTKFWVIGPENDHLLIYEWFTDPITQYFDSKATLKTNPTHFLNFKALYLVKRKFFHDQIRSCRPYLSVHGAPWFWFRAPLRPFSPQNSSESPMDVHTNKGIKSAVWYYYSITQGWRRALPQSSGISRSEYWCIDRKHPIPMHGAYTFCLLQWSG